MKASSKAIKLIKDSESLAKLRADGLVEAYPDPAHGWAVPTIGWGSTGPHIRKGSVWTVPECETELLRYITALEQKVTTLLQGSPTTQTQFDALVDFAYNLGLANLSSSTLLGLHRQGKFGAAKDQFARWVRAAGKILPGLVIRRKKEAYLYGG